jgi:hypothetical protein
MAKNKYIHAMIKIHLVMCMCWIPDLEDDESLSLTERFELWRAKYQKFYKNNCEQEKHFQIYKDNVAYAELQLKLGIQLSTSICLISF